MTLGLVLLLAGKDIYCYNAAYVGLTLCDPSYADDFITELGASAKNVCDKRADRIGVFDWKARGGLRLCRAGVECISESDHDEKNGVTCPHTVWTKSGDSSATRASTAMPATRQTLVRVSSLWVLIRQLSLTWWALQFKAAYVHMRVYSSGSR